MILDDGVNSLFLKKKITQTFGFNQFTKYEIADIEKFLIEIKILIYF